MTNSNQIQIQAKYRAKKRESMGDAEYRAEQSLKRRERRNRAKLLLPKEETKTNSTIQSNFDKLAHDIYIKKLNYLQSLKPHKTITLKSVIQQLTKIKNIHKNITGDQKFTFDFLKNKGSVIKYITTKYTTPNSQNSQLQAIASILKYVSKFESEYKFYSELSVKNRKNINTIVNQNESSENDVEWIDINRIYKKIANLKDKAMVAMLTLAPPRRNDDYKHMYIANVNDELDNDKNYLLLNDNLKPIATIYNKYKTFKIYGTQSFKINPKLSKTLQKHIKFSNLKNGDLVFGLTKDKQYGNFTDYIENVFKRNYKDSKITVNVLRHSYISFRLSQNISNKEKSDMAEFMGHSVDTQSKYNHIKK